MRLYLVIFGLSILWSKAYSENCRTPQGTKSYCVPLNECSTLVALVATRPLTADAIHFLRQSRCGFDGDVPRVCCGSVPNFIAPTTSRPAPTETPQRSNNGNVDPTVAEDSSPTPRGSCGIDNSEDKLFGGEATDLDEFPWMALLGYRTKSNTLTYQCGGVLVNRRYVLTAAHCTVGEIEKAVGTLATVRLGEYDVRTTVDCLGNDCADPLQEITVQAAYPHPGFSDQNVNRKDDIALVKLTKRAVYSDFVKPICLADNRVRLLTGNNVYAAGWGKTLEGKNSPRKLKLILPIFDKTECVSKYARLNADLTEKQLCAGGNFAQDACRGDSGGPLMRKTSSNDWESVAVVSFGFGCGRDGWPGVYTSVAAYNDWIRETMRTNNV